jgi:hypothetical protein
MKVHPFFCLKNYYELFKDALNPKQLDGLPLLVTPFEQQQFNSTDDCRSEFSSNGVTCFDCHTNGHSNGATHLVGVIRPQEFRRRLDFPPAPKLDIYGRLNKEKAPKSELNSEKIFFRKSKM